LTTFDYVIVGAGTAGCVLAERLTASGRHRVLLLEAGPSDQRFFVRMPIGYGRCFFDPEINWMYRTEPEPALGGRTGYWPRGKLLGGSGTINAMVALRGHPADFDEWASLGNPGWGWHDVLPYFRKLEDSPFGPSPLRGAGGPMQVADVSAQTHPLCEAFLQGCLEAGLPRSPDLNGATAEGVAHYQISVHQGRRVSTASAYLRPAMLRANLQVQTLAHVQRIGFEGQRAALLHYSVGGEPRQARAAREVIVCAGSINTPQLLQLSGVGPAEPLSALGIAVVHDSPAVGRHLQDHLCIDHLYRARTPSLNEQLRPWHGKLRVGLQYLLTRRGPLALSVNQAGGFVRSRPGLARPDLQLYFSPLSYTRSPKGKRPLMSPDPFPGFMLSAQPCRPASRGHVALRSSHPMDPPRIVPNSLADPQDLEDLLQGAALLRRLAATPALARLVAQEMQPGCEVQTREQMIEDIRARCSTVFHPVSTCRMGPDPAQSVVDHRLRVHGLAGLRIVDASVFPAVTSGNTNVPVVMVAEKAADLLLEDARLNP
jgi:choline dehydrogenase